MPDSNSHRQQQEIDRLASSLSQLAPASASPLAPSVFYQAGFQAAVAEYRHKTRRQFALMTAASLLLAIGAGMATSQLVSKSSSHSSVLSHDDNSQSGSTPLASGFGRADHRDEPPILPGQRLERYPTGLPSMLAWAQPESLQSLIPTPSTVVVKRGFRIGPIGADWEHLIVSERATHDGQGNASLDTDSFVIPMRDRLLQTPTVKDLWELML